ncbi:hypothetical protein EGH24_01280 [Halonotius terrestris]|uniref:DUF7508 domain-containing protein n=1 Tax=Halonotius terrestris TaxID=2487750 RepID=A0A8J8TDE9_9EURY|nr:hypothetical protein [Halonotius terrestris]TQQ83456.1 hypothetical protein EGH24_01280 [Halonotius terrestris]
MSLRKQWRDLDRSTVRSAPDRYALYEVGDDNGTSLGVGIGVLPDELRELLAYGEGSNFHSAVDADAAGEPAKVRWELTTSKSHAENLLAEHRDD